MVVHTCKPSTHETVRESTDIRLDWAHSISKERCRGFLSAMPWVLRCFLESFADELKMDTVVCVCVRSSVSVCACTAMGVPELSDSDVVCSHWWLRELSVVISWWHRLIALSSSLRLESHRCQNHTNLCIYLDIHVLTYRRKVVQLCTCLYYLLTMI